MGGKGWFDKVLKCEITVNVNLNSSSAIEEVLSRLDALQSSFNALGVEIVADLSQLEAQVKRTTDAEDSAILLLNGLSDRLKQIATDPQKVKDFAETLSKKADDLGAAVVANALPAEETTTTPAP